MTKKYPLAVKSPKTYTFHARTRPTQRNKSILAIVYLMTRKLFVILLYTKSSSKQYCLDT